MATDSDALPRWVWRLAASIPPLVLAAAITDLTTVTAQPDKKTRPQEPCARGGGSSWLGLFFQACACRAARSHLRAGRLSPPPLPPLGWRQPQVTAVAGLFGYVVVLVFPILLQRASLAAIEDALGPGRGATAHTSILTSSRAGVACAGTVVVAVRRRPRHIWHRPQGPS